MTVPITPPAEFVYKWAGERVLLNDPTPLPEYIATRAAQWGADQELEACCEHIGDWFATPEYRRAELRAARRPKPPTLKKQALAELEGLRGDASLMGMSFDAPAIRRVLEALPE